MSEQAPTLRRADGGAVRILVVDDEATPAELLAMALRYESRDVRTAADGRSAVRAARELRPDSVLDVTLPDVDGFEVRLPRGSSSTSPTGRSAGSSRAAAVRGDHAVTTWVRQHCTARTVDGRTVDDLAVPRG
jgi:two-component system OmpR family response regulator